MVPHNGLAHRRVITAVAVIIAVAALVTLYYLIDPSSGLYPRCPFKTATGLDCPGCGSPRAIHALLHGDIVTAWHCNALLLIGLPFIGLLTGARALRHRYPPLERALNSQGIILTLLLTIILWTIVRNIL